MIGRGPPPPRARGGGPTHLGAAILVIPFLKSRLVQIVGQHRGTVYLDQAVHGPFIAKNTPKVNSINTKVELNAILNQNYARIPGEHPDVRIINSLWRNN